MPARFSRLLPHACLTLLLSSTLALAAPDVFIAYPENNYRVAYERVILEGSVTPGASLTVNGQRVNVGPDGLFMEYWPLKVGLNTLKLVASQGGKTGTSTIRVTRTVDVPLPATPTVIARNSVTPRENLEFWDAARDSPAERTLIVSFKGSPGGRATFQVAGGPLQPMREGPAGQYGGQYVLPENASLLNAAVSVHLTGRDGRSVSAAAPGRLSSTQGALKTGVQKPGTIRGLGLNDALNHATLLDGTPFLYPREGMAFTLVGRQGSDLRARLAPGQSILITASQLAVTPGAPALARAGQVNTLPMAQAVSAQPAATQTTSTQVAPPAFSTTSSATSPAVSVPAVPAAPPAPIPAAPPAAPVSASPSPGNQAPAGQAPAGQASSPAPGSPAQPGSVQASPAQSSPAQSNAAQVNPAQVNAVPPNPVQTSQTASSPPAPLASEAVIRIPLEGARVPFTLQQSGSGQLQVVLYGLLVAPTPAPSTDPLVANLSVVPGQGQSTVLIDLSGGQFWGFSANYEGNDLVVRLRRPPALWAQSPLAGRTVTIDPGHGGTQKGGAGSLRVPEKNLVLPIALRVATLLRAQGATVNLTRTADTTLGLYERGLSAEQSRSDLLVSIHANALPDGRNPRGIRGPEVYFTHSQAQPLAQSILAQLRSRLPELGPGRGLMPGANLALTRPTAQISLLVETAYLTDPDNLRALMSADGQERFAGAIAQGIVDFYRSQAQSQAQARP